MICYLSVWSVCEASVLRQKRNAEITWFLPKSSEIYQLLVWYDWERNSMGLPYRKLKLCTMLYLWNGQDMSMSMSILNLYSASSQSSLQCTDALVRWEQQSFQSDFESMWWQCRVSKVVWKCVPGRRAGNREGPTAKHRGTITLYWWLLADRRGLAHK